MEATEAPTTTVTIEEPTGGIEVMFDRLDEAVSKLATLHGPGGASRRRGRIDLASLVWEVAPEARTQLEVGEGTSVSGDEGELLRMLQILIRQTGDPSSAQGRPNISVKRDGPDVKVSVHLGPDTPAMFDVERGWLSRMALRYGGRLELDGVTQTLALPADVDERVQEIQELKRELAEAQAQGQAYARELAAAFTRTDAAVGESKRPPALDGVPTLVTSARCVATAIRGVLAAVGRDLAPLRGRNDDESDIAASVARHLAAGSEIVGDLGRLGAFPLAELPRPVDLVDLVRDTVQKESMRAARRGVTVRVEAPRAHEEVMPVAALGALFASLLAHAVSVSAEGSEVLVTLSRAARGVSVTFDDAGATGGQNAKGASWSSEWEACLAARGGGLPFVAAHTMAAHLRLPLEASENPQGGGRIELKIPSTLTP